MFALQEAEAELFKGINGDKEQLSQHEYMRGISAWNFDLEALRRQASLVIIPNEEIYNSEIQELNRNGDVPKGKPVIQRSQTMPLEYFSEKDMVSESSSQLTGSLLPSFHRKFLPALGYQVGIISNESNACNSSDRAAEKLAFEEPRQVLHPLADTKKIRKAGSDQQEKPKNGYADSPVNRESSTLSKEPLADTKQVRKPGNEQEKPKNGYIVSHVNRESSTSEEILPLLQSLLVQNDIQRAQVIRLIRFFDRTAKTENPISKTEGVQIYPSKEKDLQSQVQFLEQSVEKLVEEVQRRKDINSQLEQQISSLISSNNIS
jgi:serine/threonine-protein kinase OSR1/STK39